MLVAQLLRAAKHQLRQQTGSRLDTFQVLVVAITKREQQLNFFAARFFGQERRLDAFGQLHPLQPRLDICGRGIERFARRYLRPTLIVGDECVDVRRGWYRHALRLVGGNEESDGAVVALQILGRGGLNLVRGDLFDAIAMQEVEPPIALRDPLAKRERDLTGIRGGTFARFENLLSRPVYFFFGDALGSDFFHSLKNNIAHFIDRFAFPHFCFDHEQPRIMLAPRKRKGSGSLFSLDQRFIETTGRLGG